MVTNINSSNTVSSHFLTVIKKGLEHRGINTQQLFRKVNIGESEIAGKLVRVKQEDINVILNEAVAITDDDAFSVKLLDHTAPASNLLTVLAGSCDSIQMLFNLASQRYGETYTNSVYATLDESTQVRLIFETPTNASQYPLYTIDFIAVYVVKFFRSLLDDSLATPIVVRLKRQTPINLDAFERYFCCPIEFGAAKNEVCFDKRIYELKNPLSNQVLANATKSIMEDELKKVAQIPLAQRTVSYINNQLPGVNPRQEDWAKCLNISVRNLQRQLSQEGTSFNELLKEERIKLAKSLLENRKYSVAEIGTMLHFSDSSHFIKTFKNETGVTPKAYQAQLGSSYAAGNITLDSLYGRKTK